MHELEGDPFFADPREVLRQVVARFTEMELTIVAAFELEFYLIDQENVNGRPQPPRSPISGKRPQSVQVYSIDDLDEYVECLQDIIDGARAQGIPADAIVAESAPAQFEVNLNHVNDALKACDHAVLLKRLVKNIAYDHEMDTTFMAKPYPGQAGNGLHVHISLLDKHGNNIFTSEDPEQNAALRHAIGGVLETLPASMAFLCPNVNSYRRFGSQFYVPNAPSWGLDNRTVALRVPTGSPDAVRLEHRVAGADANPYLAAAALLAGVHRGIREGIDPGAPVEGNGYAQAGKRLPTDWLTALDTLQGSEWAREAFGEPFLGVYLAVKRAEYRQFMGEVGEQDWRWYLTQA
ncbi:MAG: glutamine synthetase [Pseudomonas aeruginosa]|nr:glutamine synthetase [Pseudomonas aeruginosa]